MAVAGSRARDEDRNALEAHQAVAASVGAGAPGAATQGEAVEAHGVAVLEHLRVGDLGVGHVGVHPARAVPPGGRTGAAADGLVVAESLVAEAEVVHGALAAPRQFQGLEQGVGETLAGLHVAADDGRTPLGVVDEGRIEQAVRNHDLEGLEEAVVERQPGRDHQPHDVHGDALDDRRGGVEVARMDRAAAGEVDARAVGPDNQLDGGIPAELGNLSNLNDLHLSRNQLSGSRIALNGNSTSIQRAKLISMP